MDAFKKLVNTITSKEQEAVLLIGPGVARDAGIHTGWDLMLKTAGLIYISETEKIDPDMDQEKWFLSGKYARMKYTDVLARIAPNPSDRINFFRNYLDHKDIPPVYNGIAELLHRRVLAAAISVNFDHYLEKALALRRIEFQTVARDSEIAELTPLPHSNRARIYKPYGDTERTEIKNTPLDLESLSPQMEKELTWVITDYTLIMLGYSGGHDTGMQRLFRNRGFSYHPLFYVNPKPPSGEMSEILRTKEYIYVPCEGASKFTGDLLKSLEDL